MVQTVLLQQPPKPVKDASRRIQPEVGSRSYFVTPLQFQGNQKTIKVPMNVLKRLQFLLAASTLLNPIMTFVNNILYFLGCTDIELLCQNIIPRGTILV